MHTHATIQVNKFLIVIQSHRSRKSEEEKRIYARIRGWCLVREKRKYPNKQT